MALDASIEVASSAVDQEHSCLCLLEKPEGILQSSEAHKMEADSVEQPGKDFRFTSKPFKVIDEPESMREQQPGLGPVPNGIGMVWIGRRYDETRGFRGSALLIGAEARPHGDLDPLMDDQADTVNFCQPPCDESGHRVVESERRGNWFACICFERGGTVKEDEPGDVAVRGEEGEKA